MVSVRSPRLYSFDIPYNFFNKYSFTDVYDRVSVANSLHIGKAAEYANETEHLSPQQLWFSTVRPGQDQDGKKRLYLNNGQPLHGDFVFVVKHQPEGRVMRVWPQNSEDKSRMVNHAMLADDNKPDDGYNGVQYAGELSVQAGRFDFVDREVVAQTGHYRTPRLDYVHEDEVFSALSDERYHEVEQLAYDHEAGMVKFFEEFSDRPPEIVDTSRSNERGFGNERISDLLEDFYMDYKDDMR